MTDVKKEIGYDKPVVKENDVWVDANAIILGGNNGVRLCEGCIVGAGSVVTKDVPPYSIVAGNLAKVVKMRFDEAQIAKHKTLLKEKQ